MKRTAQSGFSAIEALVAVAIVALALVPLASLQGQVSRTVARQQETQVRLNAERNALALLREVNLADAPQASRELGAGQVLRWQAEAISPPTRSSSGEFDVTLYRLEATIADQDGAIIAEFSLEQLGWRPVAGR